MAETFNPCSVAGPRKLANAVEAGKADHREKSIAGGIGREVQGKPVAEGGSTGVLQCPKSGAVRSHRERDDSYSDVVATLSEKWRVIVCKDALQWVIQRSDGERRGQRRWTGVHYCCTRQALLRLCRASEPRSEASALKAIANLPSNIRRLR